MKKIKKTTQIEDQEPIVTEVWSDICPFCGKLIESRSIKRVNQMMKMHLTTSAVCLELRASKKGEK